MKLPHMKYGDNITKQTQLAFGGYNHTPNAKDGEIYDMQNVSSDLYPLVTQRKKRDDVGIVSGYLFKGKEFWMGNYDGNGEIFINIAIANKLISGDVIEIDVSGDLSGNSGRYIVESTSNIYNGGYVRIAMQGAFAATNSEERPVGDNATLPLNSSEMSIKLYQKVKASESDVSAEITYESAAVTSDTTKYTIEDERVIAERTQISSEQGYSKDKNVMVYQWSYDDTPVFTNGIGTSWNNYPTRFAVSTNESKLKALCPLGFCKLVFTHSSYTYSQTIHARSLYFHDGTEEFLFVPLGGMGLRNDYDNVTIYASTEVSENAENPVHVDYMTEQDEQSNEAFDTNTLTLTETTVNWTTVYKVTTTNTKTVSELERYYLNILSIGAGEHIYFVTDTGDFYYDGVYRGTLTASDKQFAQTGAFLYILPDNVYYNTASGEITEKTSKRLKAYNYGAYFNGTSIGSEQDLSMFKAGDVVTVVANSSTKGKYTFEDVHIQSSTAYKYSSHTDYDLTFTENIITRDGYTLNELADGSWGWWSITITKGVPDLKYICADANRIWGCDEKTIYCTSFGNPLGWYEYDASQAGNDADIAWTIEPFDSEGDFTGCCIYNDRPMFFKENKVYKVYGSKASDFQLSSEDTPGVSKNSHESICIIDSVLYYLSPEGVMRYTGNYGTCISDEFYESFENAVGGSDGTHYYITMQSGEEWKTFTYNTKKRLWCVEDNTRVKRYFDYERNVFKHNFDGQIQCINPTSAEYPELFENVTKEKDFESFIEFGDFYVDVLNKKAPSKLYFRFLVDEGNVEILINYDSEEADGQRVWNSVKEIQSDKKKSIIVPMIPRRCDHYRIKIKGGGKWTLYAMSYEYYVGTEI